MSVVVKFSNLKMNAGENLDRFDANNINPAEPFKA